MKIRLSLLSLLFGISNLYADKNWIPLEPINTPQTAKQTPKKDANLTQNGSISAIINNVAVIKQLMDGTKQDEDNNNNKNWYPLGNTQNR